MMKQLEVGICCISESWDRKENGIEEIIKLENYRIIKNVLQREGRGGKPVLVISEKDYFITQLCPDIITVPPKVEAVWALVTPKSGGSRANIKHIAVCSYYYTEKTKRRDFIDHISEAFNILCAKYSPGIQFIMAGDTNRLNIQSILNLSPNLRQVVKVPTRHNPDAILDTIITTLGSYYQAPYTLAPLDSDSTYSGKPSDHQIVVWRPISALEPQKRNRKTITFRPLPESGLNSFGAWVKMQNWEEVYGATTAHEKAEKLQQMLFENLDKYLPTKTIKICSEDQAWFTTELKKLDRRCKREYSKHKKSEKWMNLYKLFSEKCSEAKQKYQKGIVQDLKLSKPGQWHQKLKRMTSHDQARVELPVVQSLQGLSSQVQAEQIADQFGKISNLYEEVRSDEISLENITNKKPYPCLEPYFVHQKIKTMKNNTATVVGDIPIRVIKMFGHELSFPLSNIYKRSCKNGEYPHIWKLEIITPAPKKYPPENPSELRKISGTMNFSKIYEKFLAESIVEDMAPSSDPSQYGNEKGISTQHYLIKMINHILTNLDKSESKSEVNAIITHLVDWNQAFDRQCPKLGINSFIENGVRKSLIPVLINYFQDRRMTVKWHSKYSSVRKLPGGGPQGCYLGGLEYSSQSNDSGKFVSSDNRYKFVDDLSLLEVINLLTVGLASYNFKNHVASDIAIGDSYLPPSNVQSQKYLNTIQEWTDGKKMKLNEQKTKVMIFNYTNNYQFSTRLYLQSELLEIVQSTKLLGTIVTQDLTWWENTNYLTRKGYQRLQLLKKLYDFNVPTSDLVLIYTLYVRSILEFNSCVWHFNLTKAQEEDLERVQKVACKIILKDQYQSYENALTHLKLENLIIRRRRLCKKFAFNSLKHDKAKDMFPRDYSRNKNVYKLYCTRHSRLLNSAIPQMQRLLNE